MTKHSNIVAGTRQKVFEPQSIVKRPTMREVTQVKLLQSWFGMSVLWVLFLVLGGFLNGARAGDVASDQNFKGRVNFDTGCQWSIDGTKVTATAAQINNAVNGTSSSVLLSNAVLKVYSATNQVTTLLQADAAATVGTTLDVAGLTTLTGGLTIPAAGKLTLTTVGTVTATNGQPITLSGVINSLRGTGQANAKTNTITLVNPSAAGQMAILYNIIGATNLVAVAATGSFSGPALELDAGQSAILFAPTATNWAGIGQ
jgi:hypothetical protein